MPLVADEMYCHTVISTAKVSNEDLPLYVKSVIKLSRKLFSFLNCDII